MEFGIQTRNTEEKLTHTQSQAAFPAISAQLLSSFGSRSICKQTAEEHAQMQIMYTICPSFKHFTIRVSFSCHYYIQCIEYTLHNSFVYITLTIRVVPPFFAPGISSPLFVRVCRAIDFRCWIEIDRRKKTTKKSHADLSDLSSQTSDVILNIV